MGNNIPKIVHYCWLSDDPIPEDFLRYIAGWKKHMPDYEFIKWDFTRFDKFSSQWVCEAFDNKKYAFACDYIRLYAIYHYGGIYMDMDIEVLKPFDDLLESEYMFAVERENELWFEAGCFGVAKGNGFIKACLDYYEGRHFVTCDGFDQRPLPQIMYSVYQNMNINIPVMGWTTFTAKSYETGIEMPTEETYAVHHFAGSWKTENEKQCIEETRRYTKKYGYRIGHNIADMRGALRESGVLGVLSMIKRKLLRKIKG